MNLRLWLAAGAGFAALALATVLYVNHLQGALKQARAAIERAEGAAAASALEASGERLSAQRVDVVVRQVRAAEAATAQLAQAANEAPDADDRLPPDRALRLRAHDDELCRIGPDLCRATEVADPTDGA